MQGCFNQLWVKNEELSQVVLHTNYKADNLGRLNSSLSLGGPVPNWLREVAPWRHGDSWGEVLSDKRKSFFINNLKLVI